MQVILRGKLRSLGSTPRPGPTGKNRFLRRALPFLLASSLFAPRECLDSSLMLFLFFSSRSPRSYLFRLFLFPYLSLSLFRSLLLILSLFSLSNSLERVDAAWANPWGTLWSAVTRFISLSQDYMVGAVCCTSLSRYQSQFYTSWSLTIRISAYICQGRRGFLPRARIFTSIEIRRRTEKRFLGENESYNWFCVLCFFGCIEGEESMERRNFSIWSFSRVNKKNWSEIFKYRNSSYMCVPQLF